MTTRPNSSNHHGATGVWLEFDMIYRVLILLALVAGLCLAAANIIYGELNQDEGWYLYAARLVGAGEMPYRDFAFPQGPMLPWVYSAINPLVERFGVAGGRVFTALLGLAAAAAAARLAARLVDKESAPAAVSLALTLGLVNVYQSYYCSMVKTYSLAGLCLALGFLLLCDSLNRRSRSAAVLSGVMFAAATATRISLAAIHPIALVFLLARGRRDGFPAWLWHGAGAAAAGALFFGPFLFACAGNLWFFLVKYHALRDAGGAFSYFLYKAGFLSRLVQAYFTAFAVLAAIVAARATGLAPRQSGAMRGENIMLWCAILAVSAAHFLAPFPYEDYQAVVYPLLAAAAAAAAARALSTARPAMRAWACIVVLAVSTASALSSPVNQNWFLAERDRIWWRLKDAPELVKLREMAELIRRNSEPGGLLLTQDPYLAVETGLKLPRGLELGQFSYFPGLDPRTAARLNVLDRDSFERLLRSCRAPVAALSGYAFAMISPEIEPIPRADRDRFMNLVMERYEVFHEEPRFGQAQTRLLLLRLKKDTR